MVISKETLALINTFKNPLLELCTDIKDEVKFYFDTGIIEYVDSIRGKFLKTKTFLYRLENINFYDVYYPISLKNKSIEEFTVDNVESLFENSNYISIIGNAGCGKSMLLKHVFLMSIMQIVKIPIVIELRNLNDYNGSFFDYLNDLLAGKKLTPNKKILDRILTNGEFIFLLDGYDEIYSDNKNKLTAELIDFIDNYSKNYFFITSRPGANVESLPRFDSYSVNELNIDQVKVFINLQLKNCGDEMLAKKIINVIDKPENDDYRSYLSSPLLLSMFIMTFNSYPEIPKSKSKFYWNVFETLCTKHDSFTKHGGYQHERKTGLQNEDFENILKWFSYISLFKGKYSFDDQYFTQLLKTIKDKLQLKCSITDLKEDLTVAISIIIIDGLEYKFPHKSLQEYFTALLIKEQKEDIKKEIYSNKLDNISNRTYGGFENLWNLCNEIDSIPFKKYFVLRHLEFFINSKKNISLKDEYKSFIQGEDHKFFVGVDKKSNTQKGSLMTLNTVAVTVSHFVGINLAEINHEIHCIIYDKIKNIEDFKLALNLDKIKIDRKYSFLNTSEKFQDEIVSIVLNDEKKIRTADYIALIKKKIFDLKKEIETYEKCNSELLEL
jgi:energy-coupling factor transporter ATP-binding protein EcfA2